MKPITLLGSCKTISTSVCPNPPTLGSFVKGWSNLIVSFFETTNDNPFGIVCFVSVPVEPTIVIEVSPLSKVWISAIWPSEEEVTILLLLFSPVGYICPRPLFAPT